MKTFALASLIGSAVYAAPEAERVPEMPGMGAFDDFGLFSGYVNIGDTSKMLHYVLVESQNNPSTDPLLVWFNGGPGCSSMLGFLQEHGPYSMASGTDYFTPNEYSWNREANVLYIESPAGVGYSYCEGLMDCAFDDEKSGKDNLTALLNWYEKYPEYKEHDLFISGESYGGIYVPYLTWNIDQYNEAHAADDTVFKPNLKGFAVGNGVTNWKYDTQAGYIDMAYWHSLIDSKMH
jgi:carboxypeptidase C (cathepsin A)